MRKKKKKKEKKEKKRKKMSPFLFAKLYSQMIPFFFFFIYLFIYFNLVFTIAKFEFKVIPYEKKKPVVTPWNDTESDNLFHF